ncbi:MAG: hypothetical protein SFU25_09160 [Candidatus Caenarcaniphilales bacterium]|nr:hypothetical protein [Candidatus Caenarcaniphilales bacterium]
MLQQNHQNTYFTNKYLSLLFYSFLILGFCFSLSACREKTNDVVIPSSGNTPSPMPASGRPIQEPLLTSGRPLESTTTNNPPAVTPQTRLPVPVQRVTTRRPSSSSSSSSSGSSTNSNNNSNNTCKGAVFSQSWAWVVDSQGFKYYTGYKQISSNNQDAFLVKTDSSNKICYEKQLTNASPDERCSRIAISEQNGTEFLYLLCSTDGGNTSFRATGGGYQSSYGFGGGPKIGYIMKTRLDGSLVAGTFLGGKLSSGKTNTINLETLNVDSTIVSVGGSTAYGAPLTTTPVRSGQSNGVCEKSGSVYLADLSLDLTTLLKAECK